MGKGKIKIGNVKGGVAISKRQTGGITGNTIYPTQQLPKKSLWKLLVIIVGGLASLVTIFSYFDIHPFYKKQNKQLNKDTTTNVAQKIEREEPKLKTPKTMSENNKKETPINVGDVAGDVIISQNQTGGITAHTVYVNKPLPRELNDDDQKTLKSLDREYLISVTVIMGNESQKYGDQIIKFLQSNGYKTELNYVGTMSPQPEPARYHLNTDKNSKTIRILIPRDGA